MPTHSKPGGLVEPIIRGDVYDVYLEPVKGSETGKTRPALVLQNNTGNAYSPVVIVAPLSSVKDITRPIPVMVFLKAGEGGSTRDCYVDCGQIRTIDKTRLLNKRGALSDFRMSQVDEAIKISLALK